MTDEDFELDDGLGMAEYAQSFDEEDAMAFPQTFTPPQIHVTSAAELLAKYDDSNTVDPGLELWFAEVRSMTQECAGQPPMFGEEPTWQE